MMRPEDASVLVIEDDPNNQQIIYDLLRLTGVQQISVCSAGWQGLKQARERLERVDLILLDLQLPAQDGYGVLQRIRAVPQFKRTRVVAVTARIHRGEAARARAAGFDGFISKPLDFDRFPQQIQAILRGEEVWMPR